MSDARYPIPFRWSNAGGGLMLVAADHVQWTEEVDGHDSILLSDRLLCIPREMSPYVREVVRASGEMEALLREEQAKQLCADAPVGWMRILGRTADASDSFCERTCCACRTRSLLSRIDAAKP